MATSPVITGTPLRASSIPILDLIDRACREHGIAVTTFGKRAVGDKRFVLDLRNGRTPRPATEARVLRFIETLEA